MSQFIAQFPHLQSFLIAAVIALIAVCLAQFVDCIDAIITSKDIGQKIESAKLRNALWKLTKALIGLAAALSFDFIFSLFLYKLPYLMLIEAAVFIAIEVISVFEHARLRRDKITKIPSQIKDIVEFFGEDEIKDALKRFARKKLNID